MNQLIFATGLSNNEGRYCVQASEVRNKVLGHLSLMN